MLNEIDAGPLRRHHDATERILVDSEPPPRPRPGKFTRRKIVRTELAEVVRYVRHYVVF